MREGYIYRMEHPISGEACMSFCVSFDGNGRYTLEDVEIIKEAPYHSSLGEEGLRWSYDSFCDEDSWTYKEYGPISDYPEYQI